MKGLILYLRIAVSLRQIARHLASLVEIERERLAREKGERRVPAPKLTFFDHPKPKDWNERYRREREFGPEEQER